MCSHSVVVDNAFVSYGDNHVLRGVSLQCRPGMWVGLLGRNGSGKSTLLKALTGQTCLKSGDIFINDINLRVDPIVARAQFGYALDSNELPGELTGRQFLELLASIRKVSLGDSIKYLIDAFSLHPWLDGQISSYSYGTKKKFGILGAMVGDPPVLLFDESINGLDPISSWSLKNALNDLVVRCGKTIIMATHAVDIIYDFCTDIVFLHDGNIEKTMHMPEVHQKGCDRAKFEKGVMDMLTENMGPQRL